MFDKKKEKRKEKKTICGWTEQAGSSLWAEDKALYVFYCLKKYYTLEMLSSIFLVKKNREGKFKKVLF